VSVRGALAGRLLDRRLGLVTGYAALCVGAVLVCGIGGSTALDESQAHAAIASRVDPDSRSDEGRWTQDKPTRYQRERGGESGEEDTLRLGVATPDGVFLVYDALIPRESPHWSAGYLAYWRDFESGLLYVYGRLLFDWADVGHALLNLEGDLQIDSAVIAGTSPLLSKAVAAAHTGGSRGAWRAGTSDTQGQAASGIQAKDDTSWHVATRPLILELMGLQVPGGLNHEPLLGPAGKAVCPEPKMVSYAPPRTRLSPDVKEALKELLDQVREAMTIAANEGCDDGGGGNPPDPTSSCVCCVWGGQGGARGDPTCCQICCANKCDDHSPCTKNDVCQADDPGVCAGTLIDCNDGDPCTSDYCDGLTGVCVNRPRCTTCCPAGPEFFCCPDKGVCCDNPYHCCPQGWTCQDWTCCPEGEVWCGSGCCAPERCCADTQCCPEGWTCQQGICCPEGETRCGSGCCAPDRCCADAQCCQSDEICRCGQCGREGACCFFDSGSCSELTSACCAQQGGTYQGDGATCSPEDLCRPKCENCHTVNVTFNECRHTTIDPAEPCSLSQCTRNIMESASCDSFPHRVGPPKCDTSEPLLVPEVVQAGWDLPIPMICETSNSGGFHEWTTTRHGCGTSCIAYHWMVRCDTASCETEDPPDRLSPRGIRGACGCPP
jgi:hypothetical protein